MKEVQASPSKALDIDKFDEIKGTQQELKTGRNDKQQNNLIFALDVDENDYQDLTSRYECINEALCTPVDKGSGPHQVLRSDSFNVILQTSSFAPELNENHNQDLINEQFNKAKETSVNKVRPQLDSLNENIDVEISDEINASQPGLKNGSLGGEKDIINGLILVPANQTFVLNILEKEQKHKNDIAPRKHEVGKNLFTKI